jgi:hypothetical protein
MKGKLIKTDLNYILEDDKGVVIASTSLKKEGLSLSLKNCQAIENGYDLVNIKKKLFNGFDGCPDSFTVAAVERTVEIMFEILGDKKFSEEQLREAFFHVQNEPTFDVFKQSLQQTEWDVEIVEECLDKNCNGINKKGECITTGKPKLDEEGCLILKKL